MSIGPQYCPPIGVHARRNTTQVYLRAFAADPNRLKIWRFSKEAGEADLKGIEKVAVRFHLYVPRDSSGRRDDAFEKMLADLEQWFESPVWRVLRDDMLDLSGLLPVSWTPRKGVWEPLRKMVSLLAQQRCSCGTRTISP